MAVNSLSTKRSRRKSCQACADSKIKCDLQRPICSKCKSRDKECIFVTEPTNASRRSEVQTMDMNLVQESSFEGKNLDSISREKLLRLATQGLSIADLNGLSSNFDPFPPPDLTSTNLSSLEYLTSSTRSPPATESGYTPTDFQSAVSALSSSSPGLCSTYSNDMFEPFLSNIFSSTADVATQPQTNDTETPGMSFIGDNLFPFSAQSVDLQPFMASVEDEWFYESLPDASTFTQAPAPAPPVLANLCAMDPPIEELQHYREYIILGTLFGYAN